MQKGKLCELGDCAYKKIFLIAISEDLFEHKHHPVSKFIGHHICKQNAICALNSFISFYKSN